MKWEEEYSEKFDEYRKNRVKTSYYKYGSAKINFGRKYVSALASAKLCISKYKETHNTEYLCDAANYIMFEFMYPKENNAIFKSTSSDESAGIVGISINEMNAIKEEDNVEY